MPLRLRLPGFYRGGRPDLSVPHSDLSAIVHAAIAAVLASAPPSPETRWRCAAETRAIAAAAIAARLPWDAPPELVELAALDDEGVPIAAEDYRRALSAETSALTPQPTAT